MAPLIAGLLANGLNLIANAALAKGKEFIEEKTGVDLDQPLSNEDLAKLKEAQLKYEVELQRIQQENNALEAHLEMAYIADRQSARERDVQFVKVGKNNIRGDWLAYGALVSLASTIACLLFIDSIPPTSEKLLYVVLGALITIVKDVYSFEFGSSKDSQRNAQAVADSLRKATGESE